MTLRLIRPDPRFESSHASFIAEFQARGEELVPWVLAEQRSPFADYVAWLESSEKGVDLPTGFVPHSTWWLVDDEGEILAVGNLRHELTDELLQLGGHIGYGVRPSVRRRGHATELLRLTLLRARGIGIGDVCLTCHRDNAASARTIQRNGGELETEYYVESIGGVVQRYWIRG